MKTERSFPRLIITAKGTRWVEQGHPWIYEGEVIRQEGECENGSLVDAVSEKGKYLGTGFLSQHSKIRLRLVSRNATGLTPRFGGGGYSMPGRIGKPSWGRIPPAAESFSVRQTASLD